MQEEANTLSGVQVNELTERPKGRVRLRAGHVRKILQKQPQRMSTLSKAVMIHHHLVRCAGATPTTMLQSITSTTSPHSHRPEATILIISMMMILLNFAVHPHARRRIVSCG
jgi:hypothetical protein